MNKVHILAIPQWLKLHVVCVLMVFLGSCTLPPSQTINVALTPSVDTRETELAIPATATLIVTPTEVPSPTPSLSPTIELSPTTLPPTQTETMTTDVAEAPKMVQRKLQATAAPETVFAYVFPIKDAEVSYGSSHHDYQASDIFCPEGSSFVAVTSGVVTIVFSEDKWNPENDDPALRSGLAVGILGDDGVQYYGSHLSAVAEGVNIGMRVQAGDLLGYTGRSGNARGTPPHLHFGISRPSAPDDWRIRRGEMNPYEFLNAWREGVSMQPIFAETPAEG